MGEQGTAGYTSKGGSMKSAKVHGLVAAFCNFSTKDSVNGGASAGPVD